MVDNVLAMRLGRIYAHVEEGRRNKMAEYKLTEIVRLIDQEKLVVPDFQRGFKWRSSNIKRLLESLLLDYPIGAALLWRTQRQALEYRRIADVQFLGDDDEDDQGDAKEFSEPEGEIDFILDGQQRLTSIYRMFPSSLAPSDDELESRLQGLRFFLDLDQLGLPRNIESLGIVDFSKYEDPEVVANAILEKTHAELKKELRRIQGQGATVPPRLNDDHVLKICTTNNWLPISRALLENRLSHLHRLTRSAAQKLDTEIENSSAPQKLSELRDLAEKRIDQWTDWFTKTYVGTLNAKSFTCLILVNEKPDGLARIFETINSTGMALSVFDLLVARVGNWKEDGKSVNLRSKVYSGVHHNLLKRFDDEKSLGGAATQQLPRCLALLTNLELKKGDILKKKRSEFRPYLADIDSRMLNGLEIIHQSMQVIDQSWLPFKDLLTLSYACLGTEQSPEIRHRTIALLWTASLIEDWDSNTNDKTTRWYDIIRRALLDEKDRISVYTRLHQNFPTFEEILEAGSKSSGVFKTLMLFNLARGGLDWAGQERSSDGPLEDHHLFPKDWINNNKDGSSDKMQWITLRDSVLNRILVSGTANSEAKAQTPPLYLGKLTPSQRRKLQIPESFMGPIPTPIPYDAIKAILKDRYELMRNDFLDHIDEALAISISSP